MNASPDVNILWSTRDWASAIRALPVQRPLPCRTVLVPRERVAHALRRELIHGGHAQVLAGTRFVPAVAAAIDVLHSAGVAVSPGEDAVRRARLAGLLKVGLTLAHFPIDLLRTKLGWDEAFARTISDLEAAGLTPESLEARDEGDHRLHDVATIWRTLDTSAGPSWTAQRILGHAAAVLEQDPRRWPYPGPVLAAAGRTTTSVEARFARAIPQVTIGLLAARPARAHYFARISALFGDAAARVLREALGKLQGKALIGVVNSLGNRRDARAVAQLAALAGRDDAELAGAALWALGKIGGPEATEAVAAALKKAAPQARPVLAASFLRCADRLLADGKREPAVAIYAAMSKPDQPRPVRRAAMDGMFRAEAGPNAPKRILEMLGTDDPDARQVAAGQLGRFADQAATDLYLAELSKLAPTGQAILLEALAERGIKAALPTAVAAAKAEDPALRAVGVRCLADLGDATVAPLLIECVASADERLSDAARQSLAVLPGIDVDTALLDALRSAKQEDRAALIEVLKARKSLAAVPDLLAEAAAGDPDVYRRALAALRTLASPRDVPELLKLLLGARDNAHREEIERAILLVCNQVAEPERRAEPVLARLAKADATERVLLLPVLGRIGGPKALDAVHEAMRSDDAKLRDAGVRALCNWPDASVGAELLDMAKTAPAAAQRIAALRAYIRVVSLPSDRPESETLALLTGAMKLASRDEERRLVVSRMSAVRTMESLRWLVPYLDDASLGQAACESVVELAHHRFLTRPNKDEFAAALKKVIEVGKDPAVVQQAKAYLAGL